MLGAALRDYYVHFCVMRRVEPCRQPIFKRAAHVLGQGIFKYDLVRELLRRAIIAAQKLTDKFIAINVKTLI